MTEPDIQEALPEETPGLPAWQRALGLAGLAILAAATAWFFYQHQYAPNHATPPRPGLLATFRALGALLLAPEFTAVSQIDWRALTLAAGVAAVLIATGYIALHSLNLYIPRPARLALAYVAGMGILGVLIEVETILGLHSRLLIAVTVVVTLVALIALANYRTRHDMRSGLPASWGAYRHRIALEEAERFGESLRRIGPVGAVVWALLGLLIATITLLTFYHGALTPITYWDSLILYAGYAREIFYQQAFPFKAVAQVGIGLGANYPHLYPLVTAATATVAGAWSDAYAQVGPPLAGLLTCFLAYAIALRLTRDRLLAIALTAIFRAVPYFIAYSIYASDYAYVILFTAAFLYVALLYLETNLVDYFILATLIPGFAMHINYLMGILWVLWAAMLLLAHIRPVRACLEEPLEILPEDELPHDLIDMQTTEIYPPRLGGLLASGWFWAWLAIGLAVASPWYIRNGVLTGNPVYSFFAEIFPGTIHYNPEVMDSAVVEWTFNGDGIGKASLTREFLAEFEGFRRAADVSRRPIARIDTPLTRKLAASWRFWVTDFNAWKLAPSFIGLALPGLLIFLLGSRAPGRLDLTDRARVARRRFGWLGALLLGALLAYHYLLADFYLYQIIPIIVLIPIFGAYLGRMLIGPIERGLLVALALWIAVLPGLPFSLMGLKIKGTMHVGERVYTPYDLVALRYPGLDKTRFLEMVYGDDVDAWAALNTYALDAKVLTHENRHLVLDRRVTIVHFDDWDVQQLWNKSEAEKLRGLQKMGVKFYLFIPNETVHQVNRRLNPTAPAPVREKDPAPWELSAVRGWIARGVLEQIDAYGANRLYRFHYPK